MKNEDIIKKAKKVNKLKQISKKAIEKIEIVKFKELEGRFLHVKVGDRDRPAEEGDIANVRDTLVGLFEKNNVNCLTFVSHHAVSINLY